MAKLRNRHKHRGFRFSVERERSKIGGKSVKVVVLFLYTFDAARTQLVTNIKGRMVIGVRGFRLRVEDGKT